MASELRHPPRQPETKGKASRPPVQVVRAARWVRVPERRPPAAAGCRCVSLAVRWRLGEAHVRRKGHQELSRAIVGTGTGCGRPPQEVGKYQLVPLQSPRRTSCSCPSYFRRRTRCAACFTARVTLTSLKEKQQKARKDAAHQGKERQDKAADDGERQTNATAARLEANKLKQCEATCPRGV